MILVEEGASDKEEGDGGTGTNLDDREIYLTVTGDKWMGGNAMMLLKSCRHFTQIFNLPRFLTPLACTIKNSTKKIRFRRYTSWPSRSWPEMRYISFEEPKETNLPVLVLLNISPPPCLPDLVNIFKPFLLPPPSTSSDHHHCDHLLYKPVNKRPDLFHS